MGLTANCLGAGGGGRSGHTLCQCEFAALLIPQPQPLSSKNCADKGARLPQLTHVKNISLNFLPSVFGEMVRDREAALNF